MISIIIPVYNQAKKLRETLKSIAQQSYQDYEVIIINDGSQDNPEKSFIDYYKTINTDHKYLFLNQINQGAPAARNRGYQESRGEFLFFCDADVILKPTALEIMLNTLISSPEASYVYPSFYWGNKLFKVGQFDTEKLKKMPYIDTMALIKRVDFPTDGWDENLKKFQDWDLWLSMLKNGKIGKWVPEILFKVSTGGTMSSWLPAFAYKFLPFLPRVKKYRAALKIIQEKHGLN
ncbi:MAG: glycosyltransferase family A protein [Patescibacteria group bacterium]